MGRLKPIIITILIALPFLGVEMSPLGGTWVASFIIWGIFILILIAYHGRMLMGLRIRSPFTLRPKETSNKKEKETELLPDWTAKIVNSALVGNGFEFFPSRDILQIHHPLSNRIKDTPTVWAMWHTGSVAYAQDAVKKGNIKHLILPNPRRDAPLDKIAKLIGKDDPQPLIEDIVRVTKEVLDKRKKQD